MPTDVRSRSVLGLWLCSLIFFACVIDASPPPIPASFLPKIREQLKSPREERQLEALLNLTQMESDGQKTAIDLIPRLAELSQSKNMDLQAAALYAMRALFSHAKTTKHDVTVINAFAAGIVSEHKSTRYAAAYGFQVFTFPWMKTEQRSKPVVLHLVKALDDEDVEIRRSVAGTLAQFEQFAKPAVSRLIKSLEDEDDQVRGAVATALGNIGPDAKSAIPKLIQTLRHSNHEVGAAANHALAAMKSDAIAPFLSVLDDKDPWVRGAAISSLRFLYPNAEQPASAFDAVFDRLQDDDLSVSESAAMFVAYYGNKKQRVAAVPTLKTIVESRVGKPDADLPRINAMTHLGRCNAEGTKALVQFTASNDLETRFAAAKALTVDSPDAVPARVRVLIEGLTLADGNKASQSYYTLSQIDKEKLKATVRADRENLLPLLKKAAAKSQAPLYEAYAKEILRWLESK